MGSGVIDIRGGHDSMIRPRVLGPSGGFGKMFQHVLDSNKFVYKGSCRHTDPLCADRVR
jgi:hypothetical protein